MIITCNNCNKKFDVDSNLIPNKGRLLLCPSCNHKWFFKNENLENAQRPIVDNFDNKNINIFDQINPSNNGEINSSDLTKDEIEVDIEEELDEKIEVNNKKELRKKIDANINENTAANTRQKKLKIINILIVTMISIVAFMIIVDTFKNPIGQVVPNLEFILYNLYESIKDISLFIKDLI